jgi:hypothetical protein
MAYLLNHLLDIHTTVETDHGAELVDTRHMDTHTPRVDVYVDLPLVRHDDETHSRHCDGLSTGWVIAANLDNSIEFSLGHVHNQSPLPGYRNGLSAPGQNGQAMGNSITG